MYEDYARKIASTAGYKPKAYQAHSLNTTVLTLPFAEAHVILDGRDQRHLSRLGEDLDVHRHAQACFFDLIHSSCELHEFTRPFLVSRKYLDGIAHDQGWMALERYLGGLELQPAIIFKNRSLMVSRDRATEPYYIADMRVLFVSEKTFEWRG